MHMPIIFIKFRLRGVEESSVPYMKMVIHSHIPIGGGCVTFMYIQTHFRGNRAIKTILVKWKDKDPVT